MYNFTVDESSIQTLEKYKDQKTFLHPVYTNTDYHPRFRNLIGFYFHPIEEEHGRFINFIHPEGNTCQRNRIDKVLSKFSNLFVLNKKDLLYLSALTNVKDINIFNTLEDFHKLELPTETSIQRWMYHQYRDNRYMNVFVPLTKLYEHCWNIFKKALPIIKRFKDSDEFKFYNQKATSVFYLIERTGIKVDKEKIKEIYKIETPEFSIKDNLIYTYFNLYNTTSRPTNSFNQVNFSAIPHKKEYRELFLPTNDIFVELDYDGYHLRILGDLIGYKFTEDRAHLELGKQYFKKENLTEKEYKQAKQINFSSIYGRTPPEYLHTEFLSKLDRYTEEIWKEFKTNGYIRDNISNKKFTDKIPDLNPKKLLNYTIQSLETSNNINVLKEVLKVLRDKKSLISLYTYDSIILDFSTRDTNLLNDIKNILEQDGKFPVNIKKSKNLFL